MSKVFDLAGLLDKAAEAAESQTGVLTMIELDKIRPNELNFYDVSDVDGLVDAILMDGLLSPVVVRDDRDGGYTIISGERRYTALKKIISEKLEIKSGKLFAEDIAAGYIPCFVNEYDDCLQAELALIRANSDTRVLSSAETARQIKRMEELYLKLKEKGYKFPGRMRNHIAKASGVSASRIARLNVIDTKLTDEWRGAYQSAALSESVAYEIARQTPDKQRELFERCSGDITKLTTADISGSSEREGQVANTKQKSEAKNGLSWYPASVKPRDGALILTYALTNVGEVYKVAIYRNGKYYHPGARAKEITGLFFTKWIEIPLPQ